MSSAGSRAGPRGPAAPLPAPWFAPRSRSGQSARAWVDSIRSWVAARSCSIDSWNAASRPWIVGEAAISCSASAFAIAAARAGIGVLRSDVQERAVPRRRHLHPACERAGLDSRPSSAITLSRIGRVSATAAYVADRFCATRSWL